jgi:hypothetical protein
VKELYSQGKSQLEIEEMLGVPQPTISRWLNENNLQIIIHPSTAVDHFSVKRIFTEEGTLEKEFLELLNGKLEEGMRVQEFGIRAGKGKACGRRELKQGSSGQGELKQACAGGRVSKVQVLMPYLLNISTSSSFT